MVVVLQNPGPPCGPPFSPCWCEDHPGHPNCVPSLPTVPTLLPLIFIGIMLGIKIVKHYEQISRKG